MAKIGCPRTVPQMATVMPGVFEPPEKKKVKKEIVKLDVDIHPSDLQYRVVDVHQEAVEESDLDGAEIVVTGGWGIGDADGWQLMKKLAQALGGAVGATRPAVDEGWASESQMIGTSGRSVTPNLYIGVALSGNPHHTVGLKDIQYSIAINKDPQAAIFDYCDLGVCEDFRKIVPEVIKRIGAL